MVVKLWVEVNAGERALVFYFIPIFYPILRCWERKPEWSSRCSVRRRRYVYIHICINP
jgi:hypothetical protein